MKKFNSVLAICSAAFLLCSCEDDKGVGPAEKMGKQIDEATQEAQKQYGESTQKAQDKYNEVKQEAKKQYEDTKNKALDTMQSVEEQMNNKADDIRKSIHDMSEPTPTPIVPTPEEFAPEQQSETEAAG